MSNPSKQKGTSFEVAVRDYLRAFGFNHCERVAQAGSNDLGDLIGISDFAIECKNRKDFSSSVADAVDEAEKARVNRTEHDGVLCALGVGIVKRPRRNVSDAYCVMPLSSFAWLMALVDQHGLELQGKWGAP